MSGDQTGGAGAPAADLGHRAVRGAAHLAVRQGAGIVIAGGGALALTRLIGPHDYGLYAAAYAITTFVVAIARMGLDAALIQRADPPDDHTARSAFWFLMLVGAGVGLVGGAGGAAFGSSLGSADLRAPLSAMLVLTPICMLSVVPVALLERSLDYRRVALLELGSQASYYAVALPLALLGAGVWAPVAGYAALQVWIGVGGCITARFSPRWHLRWDAIRDLLRYGATYTLSERVWMIRTLVAPVVVGRVLGPAGVGYVSLGTRICELLSFVRLSTARVAFASFARVQDQAERLGRGFQRSLGVQVLGLGAPLAGWMLVAPVVVPRVLGQRWEPMLDALPAIAFAYLVNVIFVMHSTLLLSLREAAVVLRFRIANVAVFYVAATVLVRRYGVAGFGWADAAAVVTAVIVHRAIARRVPFRYDDAVLWLIAFAPPLFMHQASTAVGVALWLPLVAVLCTRRARGSLREAVEMIRPVRR